MLIGLNGKLRSGKDTVYQRIAARGAKAERVAFADKLKLSAAACLNISVEELERLKEEGGFLFVGDADGDEVAQLSVRKYLQLFGTEGHRDIFGDDFWLDAILPLDYNHSFEFLVATDVRFPNEIERIKDLGGYMWKVVGPNDKSDGHASEQDFPDDVFDFIIDNTVRDDNFANLDRQIEGELYDYVYG
jgi:hypothetical protein